MYLSEQRRNSAVSLLFASLFSLALLLHVSLACPEECACRDNIVTCSSRKLNSIPRKIPSTTETLELQENRISQIGRDDLSGLRSLRKLQLSGNGISFIHEQSFRDLNLLRTLLLDNNRLSCIHEDTFRSLSNLEVLTLNNNNLASIIDGTLRNQNALRTFRMHSNPLRCDCHMTWLVQWLQARSNMAVFTQCQEPIGLRGINLAVASTDDLTCNELTAPSTPSCEQLACPVQCSCNDGVADCRDRGLTVFPPSFPTDVTEIRLEENRIEVIPEFAFSSYPNLRRIDISNNLIREIEADAFHGLTHLTTLVLYSNKITSLPKGIFRDLENLELLLLNSNELKCLREDVFNGLSSLTLLSLYDNKLQSLTRRIFDSLDSIETLHLGENPFICDCNLRWLAKYLRKNDIETSGVKCTAPRHLSGKKLVQVKRKRYRCLPGSTGPSLSRECIPEAECPRNCRCDGATVDCSSQSLASIPDNIPPYAAELILSDNRIEVIENSMVFRKLRNLKNIDLSSNQLSRIEDGAFVGATSVVSLNLNNNLLSDVRGSMFTGLDNLKTLKLRNNLLTCIGNHTFAGLSTVAYLSLYSNRISTVLSGAFETMTSLKTLNLLGNPLNCDCHLTWMSSWIVQGPVSAGIPRCEEPRILRGLPVADMNPQDFLCSPEEGLQEAPTCHPIRKCPTDCECEGTIVRCGNAGFTSIPINDLPDDITELYLEMNSITEIPMTIKQFVYLRTLDLSNNRISSISDYMFSDLTRLSTLILSYNRLRCIPVKAFSDLRSLRILSLHSNDLSTLPEGLFDDLDSLSNVAFGANPWYCDCNLRWFAQWVKGGNLEAGISRCSGPNRMSGRLLLASTLDDFICQGPLDIAIAVKCNPCLSSPCQHDSTCTPHSTEYYQCHCQTGFKGKHCEMAINPCILQPCMNNALCHSRDEISYTCECRSGFEGDICETNIDDCASNPCLTSNATCVDDIDRYSCQCPSGWEGDYCNQKQRDICLLDQPCLNGATCIPILEIDVTSYRCDCPSGYTGKNCEQRIDPCLNHKCENGGACEANEESPTGYTCNCLGEYSGEYCSVPNGRNLIVQDDPCSQHDCKNGAQCRNVVGRSDYECQCLVGYHGLKCEKLLGVSFHKNGSYIQLPSILGGRDEINISLRILTNHTDGIFLYNGDSERSREHLALELYAGHVRLSYDLGEFPGSSVYSQISVNDGRTHKIEVLIQDQSMSLKIDERTPIVERTRSGSYSILNVADPLFIGGLSSEDAMEARRMWHVRNTTTFTGCIESFHLNEASVNFIDHLPDANDETRDVRPGCVREGYSESCAEARCENGQCTFEQGRGVVCRCDDGYTGERCDIRVVDPCRNHLCGHGVCVANGAEYSCRCDNGYSGKYCANQDNCADVSCGRGTCVTKSNGYRCKCNKHYYGEHCQKRVVTCKGRTVTAYHRSFHTSSNGTVTCRSRRAVVNLQCSTSCTTSSSAGAALAFQSAISPSTCCRSIKSREKKIRMICTDRTTPRQTILITRRCGCISSTTCT